MPVFSANAIQISGTRTPSRSRVTMVCFTQSPCHGTSTVSSPSPILLPLILLLILLLLFLLPPPHHTPHETQKTGTPRSRSSSSNLLRSRPSHLSLTFTTFLPS